MKKLKLPSKKEIVDALLLEDPQKNGFHKCVVVIEHRKVSSNIGYIKIELFHNGKIILKGKMTSPPIKEDEGFNWDMLNIGQSYYGGYSMDYKGETIGSIIKQGLTKSIKEGKIPFLK